MNQAQILKGSVELAILGLFNKKGKMHGYALSRELKKEDNEVLYVKEGTIYPLLLRLEKQGWLKGTWEKSTGKRKKHVYSITAAGKKELFARKKVWRAVNAAVNRLIG